MARKGSWLGIWGLVLCSLTVACSKNATVDAASVCKELETKGVTKHCKPAPELKQNGVVRKEAVQFVVAFADEVAYGGQVMVFNTLAELDAYKDAANKAQDEVIKESKLERLRDRHVPKHYENREKLLLVTLLSGPAVGKVDDKLALLGDHVSKL